MHARDGRALCTHGHAGHGYDAENDPTTEEFDHHSGEQTRDRLTEQWRRSDNRQNRPPGAQGPQYGTVTIAADGKSLIYTPTTLDYLVDGILTGNQDAFQVSVKDSVGGEVTSFVTVNGTPVAETPTVTIKVLAPEAGDPINEVRLLVTAQSGDYGTVDAGSDFIKSLLLSGSAFSAATQITDSDKLLNGNTINASSNTGLFTDEIDLTLPTLQPNTALNDTLAITATAAETESPTTTATFAA